MIKDRKGRVVEDVESMRAPRDGEPVTLSIDERLQFLAHRELKAAVEQARARGGSLAIIDAHTGEILALVNQPDYNPNNRTNVTPSQTRNRSVTDLFEPGSTMKPFTVAAALDSGIVTPDHDDRNRARARCSSPAGPSPTRTPTARSPSRR